MVHDYAMGTGSSSLRAIDEGAAEATRRVRDAEVRELADEAYRAAQALVDHHRVQLDELASTLLANEVLERPTSTGSWARSPEPPRPGSGAVGGGRDRGQSGESPTRRGPLREP